MTEGQRKLRAEKEQVHRLFHVRSNKHKVTSLPLPSRGAHND